MKLPLPSRWKPETWDDLVGDAFTQGQLIRKNIVESQASDSSSITMLLSGKPGCGKSSIARLCCKEVQVKDYHLVNKGVMDLEEDDLRKWHAAIKARSLYEGYQVLRIDECDKLSPNKQVIFLKIADDIKEGETRTPSMVVATSNLDSKDLIARYQSRFQYFGVEQPTVGEAIPLFRKWINEEQVKEFVDNISNGNLIVPIDLRSALLDLQTFIMSKK